MVEEIRGRVLVHHDGTGLWVTEGASPSMPQISLYSMHVSADSPWSPLYSLGVRSHYASLLVSVNPKYVVWGSIKSGSCFVGKSSKLVGGNGGASLVSIHQFKRWGWM